MKITELQKVLTAATNQVSAKQRWSQGSHAGEAGNGMSVIAQRLQGKKVTVEDRAPGDDAVDMTPTVSPETETQTQDSTR